MVLVSQMTLLWKKVLLQLNETKTTQSKIHFFFFFNSIILMIVVAMPILIAMCKLDRMCLCVVRSSEKSQEIFEVLVRELKREF